MRLLAHIVGWTLLIVAAVLAMRDGLSSYEQKSLIIRPLGQIWFEIDPPSLNVTQAAIERHISPFVWDPVVANLLQIPGVALFGVLGLVFLLLSRSSRRGGRPVAGDKKA